MKPLIISTLFIFSIVQGALSSCQYNADEIIPKMTTCRVSKGWFEFQLDGNAVICDNSGKVKWASNTAGVGDHAIFQRDGNFVIYDVRGRPRYSSGTTGKGSYMLFQDDLNLVIYSHPIWATGSDREVCNEKLSKNQISKEMSY